MNYLTPRVPMTHPDGVIEFYRDIMDREQTRVIGADGPNVLVTLSDNGRTYVVWRANGGRDILTTGDYVRAVKTACVAAGLDPARAEVAS